MSTSNTLPDLCRRLELLELENVELKRLVQLLLDHANFPAHVRELAIPKFAVSPSGLAAPALVSSSSSSVSSPTSTTAAGNNKSSDTTTINAGSSGNNASVADATPASSSTTAVKDTPTKPSWGSVTFSPAALATSSSSSTNNSTTSTAAILASRPPPPTSSLPPPPPPSGGSSNNNNHGNLPSFLFPIEHVQTAQKSGFTIYGTTYTPQALTDLQLLAGVHPSQIKSSTSSTPVLSFNEVTLGQLVQWCKHYKDRDLSKKSETFYAKVQQLLRFIEIDFNDPIAANNIVIPFDYYPIEIFEDDLEVKKLKITQLQQKNNNNIKNQQQQQYHYRSPIEYLRFLTCVHHNLPYYDYNDALITLFHHLGLPLSFPTNFFQQTSTSLQKSHYLLNHAGYINNSDTMTTTSTNPSIVNNGSGNKQQLLLLYVSNNSDVNITFWFQLIKNTSIFYNLVSLNNNNGDNIYRDSYINTTYFRSFLNLIELTTIIAQQFNLINMNNTTRNYTDLFAHFFTSVIGSNNVQQTFTTVQRTKNTLHFSELYMFLFYVCYILSLIGNGSGNNTTYTHLINNTTSCHWLMKLYGTGNNIGEFVMSTLTSMILSHELFYIAFGTLDVSNPTTSTSLFNNIKHFLLIYKVQLNKIIAKKELSKTDQMLINNIKVKTSQSIRDIFNGTNAQIYMTNNNNLKWLKDVIGLIKNV